MSAPVDFTVDDIPNYSPEELKRYLRRTIKYGKIAEVALRNIEEKGYHNGRVRVIENVVGHRDSIVTRNLRKMRPVVREESLPLHDLVVTLSDAGTDSHSNHSFRIAKITLSGTFMCCKSDGSSTLVEHSEEMGKLRFLKTGYSAELNYSYEIVKLYSDFRYPNKNVESSLSELSRRISEVCIMNEGLRSYYSVDTDTNVRKWLVEEGHTQRLMKDLVQQAKIMDVTGA